MKQPIVAFPLAMTMRFDICLVLTFTSHILSESFSRRRQREEIEKQVYGQESPKANDQHRNMHIENWTQALRSRCQVDILYNIHSENSKKIQTSRV